MTGRSNGWSTPDDIAARVRRRWDSGELLTAYASGTAFEPIGVPLRAPAAGELAGDLAAARAWISDLEQGATRPGGPVYRIERKPVGGRSIGRNELPTRVHLESYDATWRLLRVGPAVARHSDMLARTRSAAPDLADWVVRRPLRALANGDDWDRLLAAASWLDRHRGSGLYLRQITAPGVDTKFVAGHQPVLADLLAELLAVRVAAQQSDRPNRADPLVATAKPSFASRHGFAEPPLRLRLRAAPGVLPIPSPLSEISVRINELSAVTAAVARVLVVENEVTFLSLPLTANTLFVFGAGYPVSAVAAVRWIADSELWYWGDLDTHGFGILNRFRQWVPAAKSVLMDRSTLVDHRDRWGSEPTPLRADLPLLTAAERDLYSDLAGDQLGTRVRLEQERIDWSYAKRRLAASGALG